MQALGSCTLAVVPRKALQALMEQRPSLARPAWFDTLLEGAIFREWVVNVGRRNARARIAHLLCELAIRLGSTTENGKAYHLPLTQEHIADATGLTSVHTNRTIQALRREGADLARLGAAGGPRLERAAQHRRLQRALPAPRARPAEPRLKPIRRGGSPGLDRPVPGPFCGDRSSRLGLRPG